MGPRLRGDDARYCGGRALLFSLRRGCKAAVFEFGFKPRSLGDRLLDVVVLDVTEAANGFRYPRESGEQAKLFRLQDCKPRIEHRQIIVDQLALGLPFGASAEWIERGAAQE